MARSTSGIRKRHARTCAANPTNGGGPCRCKPSYEAAVQLRGPNRRKIRKTFATETAARTWRNDMLSGLAKGTVREPTRRTVKQAADELLEGMRSGAVRTRSGDAYKPSAIRSYASALRLHVLPSLGPVKLADVQRADVQRIADRMLADGADPSTIRNALMPLRVLYRRAIQDGDVVVSPCTNLRLPAVRGKRDRIASPEEAETLLGALPENDRALWATAFYAGLRLGELRALRIEHVDLAAGRITVEVSWDQHEGQVEPKSRSGRRTVPVPAALRDHLDEHLLRLGRSRGLVFGRSADRPFNPSSIDRRAKRAWAAAAVGVFLTGRPLRVELEPIGLHSCRHTFASLMIAAGVNVKALSTFMGHSSIQITLDRYGHLLPGSEDEAAALLDAYLGRANTTARLAQVAA